MTYGATDDFGFKAVDKPVHPHDLHATILHLLGLDHTKLTYRYSGRDFRLTDVAGEVVKGILAFLLFSFFLFSRSSPPRSEPHQSPSNFFPL